MREGERFADVCGAIDELKRSLHEEPEAAAAEPDRLLSLLDEALRMQERMEARLGEYLAFRDEVTAIAASLAEIPNSRRADAIVAALELRTFLRRGRPLDDAERRVAFELAEEIRGAAANLEKSLYRYKFAALALAIAYRRVKGDRTWVLDEDDARSAAATEGAEPWARFLPPSPHRERIVRYLRAGRAHVVHADGHDQPPSVQFEDGGLIPLPAVRWSDDVRNFHHADAPPHPHGLRYRE